MASAYLEMSDLFTRANLGVPPVPHHFRPALFEVDEWAYATREISPMAMYRFVPPKALREPGDDYVAVSRAGHGVNSYAVNYHLVSGPLALFVQSPWGGVYMDREETAAGVRAMFAACARLAGAAERSGVTGRRLVVVESVLRRVGGCGWFGADEPVADHRPLARARPGRPLDVLKTAERLLADEEGR